MDDKAVVEAAYKDWVKSLYQVFVQAWVNAGNDAAATDAAAQRFKNGLVAGRAARDHALTLL